MNNGKLIIPICGADDSIMDINWNGWKIRKVSEKDFGSEPRIMENIPNSRWYCGLSKLISEYRAFSGPMYVHEGENSFYMVFVEDGTSNGSIKSIMNILRIYKTSRIGTWFPISCTQAGGMLANMFPSYEDFRVAPYQGDVPTLTLSQAEKREVENLYQNSQTATFPSVVDEMLSFYHEAFRMEDPCIRFIMRITILEMLINGHAELTFRISRNAAVLLGRNRIESEDIYKKIRKMYEVRSSYLHDGKKDKIGSECMEFALEYSRRVIANLMTFSDNINDIRKNLDQSGFGENPYNVKF